jgi:hypothetical protein
MKTEVYSWRHSSARKAELETEARRQGVSVAKLLERMTADWFAQHRNGHSDDDDEQAAIRKRAQSAIGSIHGGDPTRAERAGELVREIIYQNHLKKSHALARRFGLRGARRSG